MTLAVIFMIRRNFTPDSIFILFEKFSAHFLNGPLQQIKKQFIVTLKFICKPQMLQYNLVTC